MYVCERALSICVQYGILIWWRQTLALVVPICLWWMTDKVAERKFSRCKYSQCTKCVHVWRATTAETATILLRGNFLLVLTECVFAYYGVWMCEWVIKRMMINRSCMYAWYEWSESKGEMWDDFCFSFWIPLEFARQRIQFFVYINFDDSYIFVRVWLYWV